MTSVTFETATIQDSLSKAEAIAPDKGSAFDKAAGIVLQIDVPNEVAVLRATNLDIYYIEWVDTTEMTGESATWRLPSRVLAAFVSSLPIGSGKTVTFTQNGNTIEVKSGRTKCSLRMIDHSAYPFWEAFDETDMTTVPDLGGRIALVEWAASKDTPAMGVRMDGEFIYATNRYKLAKSDLKIAGLAEPITIPPSTLSSVLKKIGDTRIRLSDNRLLVMPDEHTQIITITIGEPFPPVERIMNRDQPNRVTFKKQWLLDMIARTTKISANRFPVLKLIIGQEEIATWMTEEERGFIGDVISVPGQADHLRVQLRFDPTGLVEALANCPSEEITFCYDTNPKALAYLFDGSGYEVWLAPRGDPPKGSDEQS